MDVNNRPKRCTVLLLFSFGIVSLLVVAVIGLPLVRRPRENAPREWGGWRRGHPSGAPLSSGSATPRSIRQIPDVPGSAVPTPAESSPPDRSVVLERIATLTRRGALDEALDVAYAAIDDDVEAGAGVVDTALHEHAATVLRALEDVEAEIELLEVALERDPGNIRLGARLVDAVAHATARRRDDPVDSAGLS